MKLFWYISHYDVEMPYYKPDFFEIVGYLWDDLECGTFFIGDRKLKKGYIYRKYIYDKAWKECEMELYFAQYRNRNFDKYKVHAPRDYGKFNKLWLKQEGRLMFPQMFKDGNILPVLIQRKGLICGWAFALHL